MAVERKEEISDLSPLSLARAPLTFEFHAIVAVGFETSERPRTSAAANARGDGRRISAY